MAEPILNVPANGAKILSAPVTVIVAMDTEFHENLPWLFSHTYARSWFADKPELIATTAMRNSSLQGGYLILAARALGLDCGPMAASTPRRWTPPSGPAPRCAPISSPRWARATRLADAAQPALVLRRGLPTCLTRPSGADRVRTAAGRFEVARPGRALPSAPRCRSRHREESSCP